jgi:hypothetical protein
MRLNPSLVVYLFFILMGCMSYHEPIQPTLLSSSPNIKKELLSPAALDSIEKKSIWVEDMWEITGYLRGIGKSVRIVDKGDYPNSYVRCFDKGSGQMLWERSTEGWPTNKMGGMVIHEEEKTSLILVLVKGNRSDYIAVLGEDGALKRMFQLRTAGGDIPENRFETFSTFMYENQLYILALSYEKVVEVFDSGGLMMSCMKAVGIPGWAVGWELSNPDGNKVVVVYVNHWSTQMSSTLFILSKDWRLIYEEVLGKGQWTSKRKTSEGEQFIVETMENGPEPNKIIGYSFR